MQRPEDLDPDDELEAEFVFDLESEEPLEVAPLDERAAAEPKAWKPFVREDPEQAWVERWRKNEAERKRR